MDLRTSVLLVSPFIFTDSVRYQFMVALRDYLPMFVMGAVQFSVVIGLIAEVLLLVFFIV